MRSNHRPRSSLLPGSQRPSLLNLREFLDFFLPPICADCGISNIDVLCHRCHAALPWLETTQADQEGPRPLRSTHAAVAFSGRVRSWIHGFKYPAVGMTQTHPEALEVVKLLARTAAERARGRPPQYIVPVPTHRRRFLERGFNPTYRVALEMARYQGVRLETRTLLRVRNTPPQTGLDARTRVSNMLGAFSCSRQKFSPNDRVWLVDDVITTGATLVNAARALREAGVRDVVGVCLARTVYADSEISAFDRRRSL